MNATDAEILRDIRRELGKRPINITRLDVSCVNGRVSMTGVVTGMRDQPNADIDFELNSIMRILARDRKVRDVTSTVRVIAPEQDEKHDDDPRGRMRH